MTEEARLKEYLHSSSAGDLMGAVHAELIASVLEPLLSKDTGADFMFQVRCARCLPRSIIGALQE